MEQTTENLPTTYLGIHVDYSKDSLFDQAGLIKLREGYSRPEEKSPQQRFAYIAKKFGSNLEHAQRMYGYLSDHWFSASTPILAFGRNKNGMPISCFLNYIPDTAHGLVENLSETNWLSMLGGGVGIGFGIRAADEKSTGIMPHLKTYDASSLAYKQGKTRRGSYAAYLDISHPDVLVFLEMRKPTGDQNMRALNMHHGINISDSFMKLIEASMYDADFDDSWPLICPKSGEIRDVVSARDLWQKILELRLTTGEPYLHFVDTSNKAMPWFLKEKGLKIRQSNLCSEIILPTDTNRTAVCCLSSFNLEKYDEYADNYQFFKDSAEFLDNVLSYFIASAPKEIQRAVYSAERERSIGLGMLGFHAYLQSKHVAFESAVALSINNKMSAKIRAHLDQANLELGSERGEAPDAEGSGQRFSHLMAVAPNASSSIIMGNTSPSIEPYRANVYRQDTQNGSYTNKNRFLAKILEKKCAELNLDIAEIWSSIISHDGSVQHLDFLDEHTKFVYKTAMEIDQRWVIEHAAVRQPHIDQAQSVNTFFRPDVDWVTMHAVHFLAWKKGLKTLYYCRSEKISRADKVSQAVGQTQQVNVSATLNLSSIADGTDCVACEG